MKLTAILLLIATIGLCSCYTKADLKNTSFHCKTSVNPELQILYNPALKKYVIYIKKTKEYVWYSEHLGYREFSKEMMYNCIFSDSCTAKEHAFKYIEFKKIDRWK